MRRGRQIALLSLDKETRVRLTGLSRSTTLPLSLVPRVKMILASAAGLSNVEAGRCGQGAERYAVKNLEAERSEAIGVSRDAADRERGTENGPAVAQIAGVFATKSAEIER